MKNKFWFILIILKILLSLSNYSFSNEVFNFNVTEVEIKNNGDRFIGKNGGTATSVDGTKITTNNFDFRKSQNILKASGAVKIYDPKNNVIIYSDEITYFKNEELIFSKGNSKAIDDDVEIDATNFEYNKFENIIYAKDNVKINNKKENYLIYSDEITYFKNEELIFSKGNSKAIDDDVEIDATNFEYNKFENIIYAKDNVKINNKKENYLIYSDEITYFKNEELIFSKGNSKAIDDDVEIDATNFEYNKFENIIYTKDNVKINNKKENYLIYSDKVTYNKKTNNIYTNGNSRAISEGIFVNADNFSFDQNKNVLNAKGKVKLDDTIEDYIVEADFVSYDKENNKIITKGKTKAFIQSKYDFLSKNVFLDRNSKEIKSKNYSIIKDNNANIYRLDEFLYFYEKKFLKGNNIEVDTNYKSKENDKFFF